MADELVCFLTNTLELFGRVGRHQNSGYTYTGLRESSPTEHWLIATISYQSLNHWTTARRMRIFRQSLANCEEKTNMLTADETTSMTGSSMTEKGFPERKSSPLHQVFCSRMCFERIPNCQQVPQCQERTMCGSATLKSINCHFIACYYSAYILTISVSLKLCWHITSASQF